MNEEFKWAAQSLVLGWILHLLWQHVKIAAFLLPGLFVKCVVEGELWDSFTNCDYSNNVFLPVFTVRAAVPGTPGQEGQSQALLWQAQQLETTASSQEWP